MGKFGYYNTILIIDHVSVKDIHMACYILGLIY